MPGFDLPSLIPLLLLHASSEMSNNRLNALLSILAYHHNGNSKTGSCKSSIFCWTIFFTPSTTGQITKGDIMKGEIKGGNITKGTVQNETVTGADIKGANITGAEIVGVDISKVQNSSSQSSLQVKMLAQ
jgi:hypothetical protein